MLIEHVICHIPDHSIIELCIDGKFHFGSLEICGIYHASPDCERQRCKPLVDDVVVDVEPDKYVMWAIEHISTTALDSYDAILPWICNGTTNGRNYALLGVQGDSIAGKYMICSKGTFKI